MTAEQQPNQARSEGQPAGATADAAPVASEHAAANLPEDALILLPARQVVLYPGIMLPLARGRPKSSAAAQEAARAERPLGVILQRDASNEDPGPDDLYRVGTSGTLLRYVTAPDGTHHIICQGQQRFRVTELLPGYPFLAARVELVVEDGTLVVAGERPMPGRSRAGIIRRLEIPYGRFERRIELPPGRFDVMRRELADGCLVLGLRKL